MKGDCLNQELAVYLFKLYLAGEDAATFHREAEFLM